MLSMLKDGEAGARGRVAGNGRAEDPFTLGEMIQCWNILSRGVTRSDMHFNQSTLTVRNTF